MMRKVLPRLLSESAVYGLGGAANQVLAVILVPIYANVLGATNYGLLALVNTTLSLALMITTLALPQAFFRWYLKESDTARQRLEVLSVSLSLRLVVSAIGLVVFAVAALPLAVLLAGSMDALPIMLIVAGIVFFDSANAVPLSFLRAERRPKPYALISLIRAGLGSVLIILFVVVFGLGVLGVVIGSLGAAAVSASIGFSLMRRARRIHLEWNAPLVRAMLAFSLPIVPGAIAGWTLNLSDRYLLQGLAASPEAGHHTVGVYAAGYTVGLAINALAIAPFTLAWGAAYWEISKQAGAQRVIARVMTAFAVVACAVALGLSALGTDAMRLLLRPDFEPGRFVVPFSAFAYVLYGVYTIAGTGLNLQAQTRWLPLTIGGAAMLNVVLNLLLIPVLGFMGAAASTLVGYGLLALFTGAVSQRYYPVDWEYRRLLAALLVGFGLGEAALLGPDSVLWRTACILAYLPILMGLHVVGRDDLRLIVEFVQRRASRMAQGPEAS
ncbi:MAG TPA: oligosaccharide flippase family protein [Candidatus Limnocylindria bacterium]|nr:oligosaccharide flippase family protein [Candidatus Limnocylindria bacterium]